MKRALICLALPLAFSSVKAHAWSDRGHRTIAFVAEHYLRPAALDKVNKMLASDIAVSDGLDLATAAGWADRYMTSDSGAEGLRYSATVHWHFADIEAARPDIPKACFGQKPLPQGLAASAGPAEDCVISKVEQFAAELGNPNSTEAEKLLALKFLINLVGDLHQPLRVTDEHDNHGMLIPVSSASLPSASLFSYWDDLYVDRLGADSGAIAGSLVNHISDRQASLWASGPPHLWALESHQIGVDRAYGLLGSIGITGRFVLSDDDVALGVESVSLQLAKAGVRLAFVLNEALAPASKVPLQIKAPAGSPKAGRVFAMATCSVCHFVAAEQVAPRDYTMAPDFPAIANTQGITEEALREFLFGPHPTMPSLALAGIEANDVIAFILSLKKSSNPAKPLPARRR